MLDRRRGPPPWMQIAAVQHRVSPPPFRLQLMLGARWRATCHWWSRFGRMEHHRIWRLGRVFNLQTLHIGCSCGMRFDRPAKPPFPTSQGVHNARN